jgi:hypothetical protein
MIEKCHLFNKSGCMSGKGGIFKSWLGEMFEGESADTCAGKFPLVSMGGRSEGLACADPVARTPIGVRGNWSEWLASAVTELTNGVCSSSLSSSFFSPRMGYRRVLKFFVGS